jgi:copper chaperone CopZ
MKKTILISIALIFASMTSVFAQEITAKKEVKQPANISEVTLSCKMECGNCAADVKKQLAYTKGVKFVSTDFEKDLVVVKFRNDRTDANKIIASLAEINYSASVFSPGCANQKKGCCSGKTTEATTGGCSGGKTTEPSKGGCSGGKTTEPVKN